MLTFLFFHNSWNNIFQNTFNNLIFLSRQFQFKVFLISLGITRKIFEIFEMTVNTPGAQNQFRQLGMLTEEHCIRNKGISTFQLLQYGNAATTSQILTP
jgi:hypothetical protein